MSTIKELLDLYNPKTLNESKAVLREMLKNRFEKVDFNQVKSDAERFVFNNEDLSYYSKELFIEMLNKL